MKKLFITIITLVCFTVLLAPADISTKIEQGIKALPEPYRGQVLVSIQKQYSDFYRELSAVLENTDGELLVLVDKTHALPASYIPKDLVLLESARVVLNKKYMQARRSAAQALYTMAQAARAEGIPISVSSAYRSYTYQENLFARYVKEMGEEAASRVSARPGHSQHQLGTAFDFGSVTNEFAVTRTGKWLMQHAREYGFSLSYPEGLEELTGYSWESWHYRYVGVAAAQFEQKYFLGIQQLMLVFLHAYGGTS